MGLLLAAIAMTGLSGFAGIWLGRRSSPGQRAATLFLLVGAALGLWAVGRCLVLGESASLAVPWLLPWGTFRLKVDALSAVFLAPVFLIPALGSIYGTEYWRAAEHPANARSLQFYFGVLTASMAVVVLAETSVIFLIAWEVMALSAYLLATSDAGDPAASKAGWLYLVGAHVGVAFLFALFALLYRSTGSFALETVRAGILEPRVATAIFVLGLVGFGLKVGFMPLHLFLPGAPAASPSHVSALLSGVVYKVGIYGLVRILGLLPSPPSWWGGTLLFAGAFSAVLGVVFALSQANLKRALAYSSFENVGIIAMGVGLALLGRTFGRSDWILLGLGGALFHSWNHALFKSLLFFLAGSLERSVRTTDLARLGGLAKTLPRTAALFIFASVAISGLPPLNGFASELLIYLGLFRTAGLPSGAGTTAWPLATLAVPCLALTGALALACFINLTGMLFLGQRRSAPEGGSLSDPPRRMSVSMILLGALCALLGLVPGTVLPAFDRAIGVWTGARLDWPLAALVPTAWMSGLGLALLALGGIGLVVLRRLRNSGTVDVAGTWDCGYSRPSPRMAYTGSSFGHALQELFRWALWPRLRRPDVRGPFPKPASLETGVEDPVLDRITLPGAEFLGRGFAWLRLLQQGRLQIYMLYFIVVLVLLLVWGRSTP
jgi:formate hydrogenlyase subunit 3/multisubunit Na+/H+ antiporter MnhD subunit